MRIDFTIVARIPLGELVAFAATPFLHARNTTIHIPRSGLLIIVALSLWMAGICVSDVANGLQAGNFARAVAKPLFCLMWTLFFLGIGSRSYRCLMFYPIGMVIAAIQNYLAPQAYTAEAIEQGGYGAIAYGLGPIIISASLFAAVWTYSASRVSSAASLGVGTFLLFAIGAPRSSVALAALNGILITYIWWSRRRSGLAPRLTGQKIAALTALTAASSMVLFYSYIYIAEKGWLGDYQYQKYLEQKSTPFGNSIFGLIAGGRTEVLAAAFAIADNPIIGYGSWRGSQMSEYYVLASAATGADRAEIERIQALESGTAGHSVLLQAWLENGALAALSLVSICCIVVRQLAFAIVKFDSPLTPLIIFFGTAFAWDFLFSPFGVSTRIAIGLFFALRLKHPTIITYRNHSTQQPHISPAANWH